jgi:glycine cleavage system aminomethyltransferase T
MLTQINDLFGGFAEIKEVNGNQVVAVANDRQTDYTNIRNDVGVLPMTFTSYYEIMGDQAEEILDYLLTKSVQYLNYGQNRMCYFLKESGDIEAFVTLYKNDETFIIEAFTWDVPSIEAILNKSNISFEKLNYSCILMEGLKTIEFMTDAMELTVDYFVYQSHQDLDCFGKEVMIARTGYTGEFGYKLIGDVDTIQFIWENILPAHKSKVVGYDAFEMCQYEIKQPFWELPYLSLSKNAFEVDYHWLVDFKKDIDYVGKEALFNAKLAEAVGRVIGALTDTGFPVGVDVMLEGEVIGKVIDSRLSYGLDKYITMLFVDKEYAHVNVNFETAEGQKLTTVSAPYIFPASWTVDR